MSQQEIDEIWNNLDIESSSRESNTVETDSVFSYFWVDLETTSLKHEIIQVACVSVVDNHSSFSNSAVPDNNVSAHAAKVNKLSTAYSGGKNVLLKGNVIVSDISEEQAIYNFVTFLEQINKASNGSTMLLTAHNWDGFDFPVLVNSLAKHSLLQRLEDLGVLFLDSLKVLASPRELKRKGKESQNLILASLLKTLMCMMCLGIARPCQRFCWL